MALSSTVFHQDFQAHHQPVVDSTATARVLIERVLGRGEWTPDGGMGGDVLVPIYSGRAMIEASANPTRGEFANDIATIQTVKVQIGFLDNELEYPADFQWHDNDRVTIITSPDDPQMEGVLLYVHGWLGTSYSWARNLVCRTNTKQL